MVNKVRKLRFSVNTNLIDKIPPQDKRYLADGFISVEGTIEDLAQAIADGWAFSYQFVDQKRSKFNFSQTDIIAIDVDDGWTILEALENPIIKSYCSFLYTTPSHTLDKNRYRLVFVLPKTLTNSQEVRAIQIALAQRLMGDLASTDPARMFYGNTQAIFEYLYREITESFLNELLEDGKTIPVSDSIYTNKSVQTRSSFYLDANFEFRCADQQLLKFFEFDHKTSVFCPFHPDGNPSAFISLNTKKNRFMYCSTCRKTYWLGKEPAEFNFNEFDDAVRFYKENPPNRNSADLNNIETSLFGRSILESKSIVLTSIPYIELYQIEPGITFVKSLKGSGKTTFLKRALDKILFTFGSGTLEDYEENDDPISPSPYFTEKKVLLIGHRQALIREMCQKLSLDCYLDDSDTKTFRRTRPIRYGVCLDSLHLVSNRNSYQQRRHQSVTEYDLIIIDESEQVLSHFMSETLGEKRKSIYEDFNLLLQNAKSIIALDADLGWITFNTITRLAKVKDKSNMPIKIYINDWKPVPKDLFIYPKSSQLISHIKDNIIAGKRVFISSNSKAKIQSLEVAIKELATELGINIPMISLTSENSKSKEIQGFIKNIKSQILNFQVILASPTLGTGIDITFDGNEELIDCVYGLYEAKINTHTEIDQQLGRVRHPKEVHIWISPVRFSFETEFDVIKDEFLDKNFVANIFNSSDLDREVGSMGIEGISDFTMMASLIVRYQRASKNKIKINFLNYKNQLGWNIVFVPDDETAVKTGNKLYKLGKKIVEANRFQSLLDAKPIEKWQFEEIQEHLDSNDQDVSRDDFCSFLKAKIETFYRVSLTQELIKMDNNGRFRYGIKIYENITNKDAINNFVEEKKITQGLNLKLRIAEEKAVYNFKSKCILLYELFSATPFYKNFEFDSNVEYAVEDLKDFVQLALKLKPFIDTHLDISLRKDFSSKPTQQLGQILKLVGLGHLRAKSFVIEGVKYYKYCLNKTLLDKLVTYVAMREIHRNEWTLYNECYGFKEDYDPLLEENEVNLEGRFGRRRTEITGLKF